MNIKPIVEEWVADVPSRFDKNITFPIYSVKSQLDLAKAAKDDPTGRFRFIADSGKKELYVFSSDLLHGDADKELNINKYTKEDFKKPAIYGQAIYKNGVATFLQADLLEGFLSNNKKHIPYFKVMAKINWAFATAYISGLDKIIEKVKKVAEGVEDIKHPTPSLLRRAEHIRKRPTK